MNEATPEPRRCEVCGDPIRRDNKYGICTNGSKPECIEARRRKRPTRSPSPHPESDPPRRCEVCGTRLNRNNQLGICGGNDSAACAKERSRRRREGFAASHEPVITAGRVFGNWTALEDCAFEKHFILCRCECGNKRRVRGSRLTLGLSRDCGCAWKMARARAQFPNPYIPAGATFGRLTVLADVPRSTDRASCCCACGTRKEVNAIGLKAGTTKSCGCLSQERRSSLGGFSKHPLYGVWNGIIDRCTDPKHPSYYNYGGRGITVCDRWRDPWLFAEDIEREIGPRPEGVSESGRALYSLDRIENNHGYESGNIQWSTMSEQGLNQRKVSRMTLQLDAVTRERDALAAKLAALEGTPGMQCG